MAADTDKQQKDNGLKDYGIIYISGAINSGTAEGVCKEIIGLNIKGEVNQIQMTINCRPSQTTLEKSKQLEIIMK
ncbi:MAG TPA: hypothetical protein HPP94_07850 [Desulfuromonadales bacterium]|nr:hypothetical protein [Desulfuromonadales bacterium]